jgi:molecular chaperone DnaJ
VRKNQKINIKIPAGIDDGQTISLRGQGNAGQDGGPQGDLLVTVMVKPHPLFERDGNAVLLEMPVTFAQAALGDEIEVPTIDGKVKLTIPEGTQPGSIFRLRGKGIPYLQSKSGRGDQFVTISVSVPKNMTTAQKESLRSYARAMNEKVPEGRSGIFGGKKRK